jgi:uncharacterized protein YndB with AHSA1/START domain
MTDTIRPVAETGMLIRKPVADVFQAFAEPSITTKFWFTESSGSLKPGASVIWTWQMYGASTPVTVVSFEPDQMIRIEWGEQDPSIVTWTFTPLGSDRTFVAICNDNFGGSIEQQQSAAMDSIGGFCWVLAGAKAWLEHGIALRLIEDRFPPEIGHA